MKKGFIWIFVILGIAIFMLAHQTAPRDVREAGNTTQAAAPALSRFGAIQSPLVQASQDYGRMPLYFIANKGQVDKQVAYYVQGVDKSLYFTSEGITFALNREKNGINKRLKSTPQDRSLEYARAKSQSETPASETGAAERWIVKLDFIGANSGIRPIGRDEMGAVISYFSGKPEDWHAGIPTYSRIVYQDLWPGIDLVYSGTINKLKYEFIVHPGADPSRIRLGYRGATDVTVNDEGRLLVSTPTGGFEDDKPVAYQEIAGRRVDVALAYRMAGAESGGITDLRRHVYGFDVGDYDQTQPLVLDPAVLVYCGYIGGSALEGGQGIAVDASGSAYITGSTASTQATFPVLAGPDLSYNGTDSDAFVAKVNPSGTGLVYCGYIGGAEIWSEGATGIAVDASGNAYVVGSADSTEATFPVVVGPDLTYNGGGDVFVAKVNPSGTGLVYCGYIGGSGGEYGGGIAVDSSGCAYVVGATPSDESTFPVSVGPNLTHSGQDDAFVAKVKADGTGLVYCGYIGGWDGDAGYGVAVDKNGYAYIAGAAESAEGSFLGFPVVAGPDLSHNGAADAFVAKVDASGASLVYCGFIGGSADDSGVINIAVDDGGCAYVVGDTGSDESTFPVQVGPDLTYNSGGDAFVAKVSANGTGLVYCGYIGGSSFENGAGVAVDSNGCAYVSGFTGSTESSFPVLAGPDLTHNGGYADGYIAKVNPSGSALVYCGYIGGSGYDWGEGVAVDIAGNAYVTGMTASFQTTFPVRVGPDVTHNGSNDVYVAKITYWDPWVPKHAVGDFDGDGMDEVAVDFGPTGIYLYDNGAWSQISSANPEGLLAAQVDGDSSDEVLADLGSTGLWLWNGGAWNQLSGVNVEGLAAGDVDADGIDEVVGDFGTVGLWLWNGGAWTQLSGVNADYVTVANADGAAGDEIFGDFGATGLWVWNTGSWTILSGVNADYVMTGEQTGARFILGDFGPVGLWLWAMPGLTAQLSGVDADYTIAANTDGDTEDEIIGDFGATGLWHWDGGTWAGLTGTWTIWSGVNAEFMIRADVDGNGSDEVAADFGSIGLWLWNGGVWTQISGVNPEYMLAGDFDGDTADEVMADFGTLGLWLWNAGAWSQVSPLNPE